MQINGKKKAAFFVFTHIVARGGDMERGRKGIYLRFERMALFYRGDVEF